MAKAGLSYSFDPRAEARGKTFYPPDIYRDYGRDFKFQIQSALAININNY